MIPDFFALRRPPRLTETVAVTGDGRSVVVTLRAMDLLDSHRMQDLRDAMIAKYVGPARQADFPPVGGEPVELGEATCEACAALVVMQVPDSTPQAPSLTFESLVAMAAACPHLFVALAERAAQLNASGHLVTDVRADDPKATDPKEEGGESTANGSGSRSSTASPTTPNLSSVTTPF